MGMAISTVGGDLPTGEEALLDGPLDWVVYMHSHLIPSAITRTWSSLSLATVNKFMSKKASVVFNEERMKGLNCLIDKTGCPTNKLGRCIPEIEPSGERLNRPAHHTGTAHQDN